jgi:hypothetical protein
MTKRTVTALLVFMLQAIVLASCSVIGGDNTGTSASALSPSFVQSENTTPQDTPTSASVSFDNAVAAGDLVVVVVGFNTITSNVTSVTDSLGNAFQIAAPLTRATANVCQAIYYAFSKGAGPDTINVTFSDATFAPDVRIAEYANVAAFDSQASSFGTDNTQSTGPLTTATDGELLVAAGTTWGSTDGPGPGYRRTALPMVREIPLATPRAMRRRTCTTRAARPTAPADRELRSSYST